MIKEIVRDIQTIQEAKRHQRLVIFVGAGVSCNSGLPSWKELISALNTGIAPKDSDDLKVAQYYKDYYGVKEYADKVKEALKIDSIEPNAIHKLILDLNPQHIITTNYDTLLEQHIESIDKQFAIIRRDNDLPYVGQQHTLVKMHGDFLYGNFVLSENDYYNYSRNFPLTRAYVQSLLASNLVLFIGFSFNDINLKYIINELLQYLKDDMQPVYFLTDEEVSKASFEYYHNKNIHILSISEKDIAEICRNTDTRLNSCSQPVTNPKGRLLYNQLNILNNYQPKVSFVDEIISFIGLTKDEIVAFADGLRYIIPREKRSIWNLHSTGLQLYSDSIDQLKKDLGTYAGRKSFYVKHRNQIENLRYFAYCNCLNEIDHLNVLSDRFLRKFEKDGPLEQLYTLDFVALQGSLKFLHANQTGTLADLEEPYMMVQLGDYLGAFDKYFLLASEMLRQKKYVLRFICYYNMLQLRGKIYNSLCSNGHINDDYSAKYNDIIDNIDLDELLIEMPIDKRIKQVLKDVITTTFQSYNWQKENDLKDKLGDQRRSSENGGWSLNSNAALLIGRQNRFVFFYQKNFILTTNDVYANQFYQEFAQGLLQSIMTESVEYGGRREPASRITAFDSSEIASMIFRLDSKTLQNCLKRTRCTSINLSEEGLNYLCSIFEQAKTEIRKQTPFSLFADHVIIRDILQNMVIISTFLKEQQRNVDIFPVVAFLMTKGCELKDFYFYKVVGIFNPHPDEAKRVLSLLVSKYAAYGVDDYYCRRLAKKMQEEDLALDNTFTYDKLLEQTKDITVLGAIANVLTLQTKSKIIGYIRDSSKDLQALLMVELNNKLGVLDKTHIEELISKYAENPDQHILVCEMLAEICRREEYSEIHDIIKAKFQKDPCFSFYYHPEEYLNSEDINPLWICCFHEKEDIQKFLSIKHHRETVKNFVLTDVTYGRSYKDKIWKLL